MPTFPVLTQGASVRDYKKKIAVDPTLRSQFESGYQLTRNRFTSVPREWHITFEYLTADDKSTLEAFEKSTAGYGGTAFDWENTATGDTVSVRFGKDGIQFSPNPIQRNIPVMRWKAEFKLIEANPQS